MRRLVHGRISPSMVVALVALFAALGGTAVASLSQSKGDAIIKKHSLSGNRLKNHTITGTQVKLGKLGKVPQASHADTAGSAATANSASSANRATTANNAANANTVGGQTVTKLFATVAPGASPVQVYSKQGLTISLSCPTSTNVHLVANGPAANNANLDVQGNQPGGAFESRTEPLTPTSDTVLGSGNHGAGVAEYGTSDGHVVSVTYGFDDVVSAISSTDCAVWGHATSS